MVEQHERPSSAPDPCPFHGVRMRRGGRWVSEIRVPASRHKIWLGSYAAPEQAARAYDVASLLLDRPFPLNFSDSTSLLNCRRPHLSAASSLSARRFIRATAYLAARLAPTNSFHPTHENGSSSCATVNYPDCDLGPVSTSAYLQEDCSWTQEVCGLLAPEEPATTNGVSSTTNIGAALATLSMDHDVLDAAAISLRFDAVASCSSATAGEEVQEELVFKKILEDQEYEEWFLDMIAVDGFTPTSATVTTRHDVEVSSSMAPVPD